MQIAILFTILLLSMFSVFTYKIIRLHLEDIEDEIHSGAESLKMMTENLDEFEFEKGLKKWGAMGARERNKRVATHYLGWVHLGTEWQDRNGEVFDEPSDFTGENFSKFIHTVNLSEKDKTFLTYCLLWKKGFKITK